MSDDRLRIAHQLRLGAIPNTDSRHFCFFEVPVDPKAVGVDDGDIGGSDMRKIADAHEQVSNKAVYGTAHLGPLQVNLGLSELLLSGVERGLRLNGIAGKDLLLRGRGQVRQMLTPLGLKLL